jgi:activator of 2-hydroxyglutaryl-CoA dehydratase
VTKNQAMVETLNRRLGLTVNVGDESHFMGALGAALFALDRIVAARAPAHAAETKRGAA